VALGTELASLPQSALVHDRLSAIEQWSLGDDEAMRNEVRHGLAVIGSRQVLAGAQRFASGAGRHGESVSEAGEVS
jgi:enoyl-CoA hydratase